MYKLLDNYEFYKHNSKLYIKYKYQRDNNVRE